MCNYCNLLLMCAPALQQPCNGNIDDGCIRGICPWNKIGLGYEKTHGGFAQLDSGDTA